MQQVEHTRNDDNLGTQETIGKTKWPQVMQPSKISCWHLHDVVYM